MKSRHLTLSLAVALGLASPSLSAMGLGPLQVKSGLNQPLVAEIPILSATPGDLEQLDVRLASPEAFARIGLDRPGELTANLQFSVGENSRGQPVILVTTPGRFSEPLLNFLIEAEWGKGTVTREYTALIDPPYIASAVVQPMQAPAPAPVVAPVIAAPVVQEPAQQIVEPAAAPTPVEPEPSRPMPVAVQPEPAPAPVQPMAAPVPEPMAARPEPVRPVPPAPTPQPEPARPVAAEPAPAPAPGQYGPVSPGQNLWNIANSVRPDPSISVNQMMVALLRANPAAFDQDNINRLKQGSVLRVPGQDEASRLSAGQAAALVSQQASAWRTPRQPVPQPVEIAAAPAKIAPEPGAKPAAPAAPTAAAPTRAATPSRASSRLEIVPPSGNAAARGAQSGAAAGAGGTELRAELVQAREELAAKDSEVTELRSRLTDLEKQDADRQRLIEMQNSKMKELQDRLAQAETAPAAAAPASVPTAADAAPAEAEIAPVAPWYLNPFVLGGAVLVLLGGMVLAMRRSKPRPEAEPSRRISDDDDLRASMAKTRQAGERIRQEPALGAATPMLSVDPELDARIQAVAAKPHDLETHLSLLRLHHSRGNAVDYEQAAQAMRGEVGSTMDPRWREAVVMGASLMPGHALFGQAGWNSPRFNEVSAPAALAAADEVRVFEHPEEPELTDYPTGSLGEAGHDRELDFGNQAAVLDETFGDTARDIHRDEARMMDEDESSATRIELAKAYLDIGDLDGARSMLEDVLAEGGPTAKAEAGRLLKEIG